MGAGAIGGEQTWLHGQSSQSDSPVIVVGVMSCESCSIRFSLLKRKKLCLDCGRHFCSACVLKVAGGTSIRANRRCTKCQTILGGDFTKQDLIPLKVKDLRFFLTKRNIQTRTCTEKDDLMDLIFRNFANSNHRHLQWEHEQHVERLAERMREARDQERRARTTQGETTPSDPVPESETDPPAHHGEETEENREESLRERQDREMRDTLNRLYNELHEEEENQDGREPNRRTKLSDIESLDDVEELTAKQLKEVLATNFVDYKGCCEKWELAERVRRLWKEDKSNKQKTEDILQNSEGVSSEGVSRPSEEELCKICMDSTIDCVLLECGHMVTCTQCGKRLAECPICRQYVVRAVHIFRS